MRWRITPTEAGRRLTEAALLGPRHALSGEPLEPVLAATAAAQSHGLINAEHLKVIRMSLDRLSGFIDTATRTQTEVDWVRTAVGVGPKELQGVIDKALFLLDQDGPEPEDTERARKRGITTGEQGRDAMTPFHGNLTPETAEPSGPAPPDGPRSLTAITGE